MAKPAPATSDERAPAALEVRDLKVTFNTSTGAVPAVRGVDLVIRPGETLALLGESGSGKSVTARAIMGLHDQPHVDVRMERAMVGGRDLLAMTPENRRLLRGSAMTMVFQDALSALNPVLTIGDQIGELFRVHRGASRKEARERAVDLLELVGIPAARDRVRDYPHQFSGGMRQRILIAMAVALEPALLIADEPTTALDVTVQAQILRLIDRLRRELGTAVLLITHDLGVAAEVADRIAVMYAGRIVETSPVEDLYDRPAHPYTEALLAAIPDLDRPSSELLAIPGTPPRPGAVGAGCAFAPRCTRSTEICADRLPALTPLVGHPHRTAACHHTEEVLHAAVN
ncbi:peptide/nickel transport system ATP-binding protein/oligopeptide transport system ATP-binding protein [Sinosporangium album]|uniref:Peptide/nickel transport system ATP-binding protein/oligopeptide transport system ATP-binding protein n=1 Tax=Sinosporangium album TaxID=504805 RepID=A0A1G7TB93_9ACTN|nr:ABC transporter ATP-binding protein [Sinosporangium album]SDG32637.1 peptide/nickel transport system ATP-binding protein/oligopeptide transport system ATP-binding protein [Sinosporangium album]